jgi:hypothetical protein
MEADEKADGRCRRPYRLEDERKVRENADRRDTRQDSENACKSARFRRNVSRLKIVVSPVRFWPSPSCCGSLIAMRFSAESDTLRTG